MKTIFQAILVTTIFIAISASCQKNKNTTIPSVNTIAVSLITDTSALSGGEILEDGNESVYSKGIVWGITSLPSLESNDGMTESEETTALFRVSLTGLDPNTTYFVRAFARNNEGTAYGPELSFHTLQKPVFSYTRVESVTDIAAQFMVRIEFTDCTERGLYWSTLSPAHETGSKITGTLSAYTNLVELHSLDPGTKYYAEAYAISPLGIFYGKEVSFTTKPSISGCIGCETGSVSDVEANEYNTVKIGDQWWMSENLRTTRYRNGDAIPKTVLSSNLSTGAYCWYNNDSAGIGKTYGALYNWFTVIDNRNVCPAGWHVPASEEMETLTEFLGGSLSAGGRMKETGTEHWVSPNNYASNESGFNGLPGGSFTGGVFQFLGKGAFFWLSEKIDDMNAWNYQLTNDMGTCVAQCCQATFSGYSIRCIKD